MDGNSIVLVCGIALVGFVVVIAMLSSAARRFNVRPGDNDIVQSSWSEHRALRNEAINGGFWRFIAKVEFPIICGLVLYVSITQQSEWYWIVGSGFGIVIGIISLFA